MAAAVAALKHPSAGVRRNAIQVLPRDAKSADAIVSAGLLRDPDAQVRLAASWAWPINPPSTARPLAVVAGLAETARVRRRLAAEAATAAAATNDAAFLSVVAASGQAASRSARDPPDREPGGRALGARRPGDEAGGLLTSLPGGDRPPSTKRSFEGWPAAGPRTNLPGSTRRVKRPQDAWRSS